MDMKCEVERKKVKKKSEKLIFVATQILHGLDLSPYRGLGSNAR